MSDDNRLEDFKRDLASLINKYGLDNDLETPDFILAQFVYDTLYAWKVATARRDEWSGFPTLAERLGIRPFNDV